MQKKVSKVIKALQLKLAYALFKYTKVEFLIYSNNDFQKDPTHCIRPWTCELF